MTEKKKHSLIFWLFLLLFLFLFIAGIAITVNFIFHNSMESGVVSYSHSDEYIDVINYYAGQIGLSPMDGNQIRKVAHFLEYALLGFLLMLCLRFCTPHYFRHISWPLLLVLGTANADETLQLFSADRTSLLTDIWIDFAGGCMGILAGLIPVILFGVLSSLFRLIRRWRNS